MTFSFSKRSLNCLATVHKNLAAVAHLALEITPLDFGVIEGLRTGQRQHELFEQHATQIDWPGKPGEIQGRHLTGHAIDYLAYVDGIATMNDLHAYALIAQAFKTAAARLNVKIHWGGDNPHWKDYDHIELDRAIYPDAPLVA